MSCAAVGGNAGGAWLSSAASSKANQLGPRAWVLREGLAGDEVVGRAVDGACVAGCSDAGDGSSCRGALADGAATGAASCVESVRVDGQVVRTYMWRGQVC